MQTQASLSPSTHRAGQKIRAYRSERGLSAAAFGEMFDPVVHEQTVYGWEAQGKRARPSAVRKLDALGICAPGDWYALAIDEADEPARAES
jgi:DNA-binding transcriptional regulator YiaG